MGEESSASRTASGDPGHRSDSSEKNMEGATDALEAGEETTPDLEAEELQKEQEREERSRLRKIKLEKDRQASWKSFMERERGEIELRKDGQLARILEKSLAGDSPEALRQLAIEDQRQAEEGLVALISDGKVRYKKLEDLTIEDQPARTAANSLRTAWLKERSESWGGYGD